uniref:DNA helicase n=1 Tax=Plectus sambesii TaxID=2011161 RepID=A0A914X8J7_9BILA
MCLKCLQDLKDARTTDVRMLHDGYMKLYHLEHPKILRACGNPYDAILIDEAQNMNLAILDFVSKQTVASNTITSTFYLTQSFRFGSEIAFIGNCWLEIVKGESRKLPT